MSSSLKHEWYTVTFRQPVPDKNLDKAGLAKRIGLAESRISDEQPIVCLDLDGKTFSFWADLPRMDFVNDDRAIDGPWSDPRVEPFS